MKATSTYKSFLMEGEKGSELKKLLDITGYPDMGQDPSTIEVTTMSHPMQVFIEGLKQSGVLAFTANYDRDVYKACKNLEKDIHHYELWFGGEDGVNGELPTPTGSEGKFGWDGKLSVRVTSGAVNAARAMTVSIVPSTEISFLEA